MPGSTLGTLLDGGPRLSVGIITADLLNLGAALRLLEAGGAQAIHLDVGDGVFSPLFTLGPPVVKAVKTPLIKDVHLLVEDPLAKVDAFVDAGADMITFQLEGVRQPHRVLQALNQATNVNNAARGIVRGVALTPSTPLEGLGPLMDELDYILILAVNPGWSGQPFPASAAERLRQTRRLIEASGREIALGVDGAVTQENMATITGLGTDVIVSGSAIFDGKAPAANLAAMLDLAARRQRAGTGSDAQGTAGSR